MNKRVALTTEQETVVGLREGSYLVLAPPGAGKTEVIAQRIVRLLEDPRGDDYRILALTFNARAAASMRARVRDRLGDRSWRSTIETYHAFYLDVLRHYGSVVGVPPEVTIYDTEDARIQALAQGLEDDGFVISGDELDRSGATAILDEIARLRRSVVPVEAVRRGNLIGGIDLQDAYSAYDSVLRRNGAIDFDSILARAYELFTDHPQVAQHYRKMYRFILIDEAQDTSSIQFELLRLLCGDTHRNVLMVADPDQLINRWLGADKRNLDRFVEDFNATVMPLTTNFRCADEIVHAANLLISSSGTGSAPHVTASGTAKGWTKAASYEGEESEASAVVEWVTGLLGGGLDPEWLADQEDSAVAPEEIAILARSRLQLTGVLQVLDSSDIPYTYRVGEPGPFDTAYFVTALDLLKVLANPRDVAMRRTVVARLGGDVDPQNSHLHDTTTSREFLRFVAGVAGGDMAQLAGRLSDVGGIAEAMTLLTTPTGGEAHESDLGERLRLDREQVLERWTRYRFATESEHWSWAGVVSSLVEESREDGAGLRVSTVHAAKGLEFRAVAIVGLNEGSFPDFRSLEGDELAGERRLAYVAATRSARALLLTRPRSRVTRYGTRRSQDESQFIGQMGLRMAAR